MRSRLSLDALKLFAGDAGARLLGFVATVHIANVLSPDQFGSIVIGLTVLSYALWFSDLGLNTFGTREFALSPEQRSITLSDILSLKTLLALAMLALGEAVVFLVITDPVTRTISALYLLTAIPTAWLLEWYFQGIRNYTPLTVARYLLGITYVAGIYLFLDSSERIAVVPVLYGVANMAAALYMIVNRRKEDALFARTGTYTSRKETYRAALASSTPIGLGSIFAQVVHLLPPIVIAAFYTTADAGIFGAAMRITLFLMVIDKIFIALFFPAIANLWAVHREKVEETLRVVFLWIVASGGLLIVVMGLLSNTIMVQVFGDDYSSGGLLLAVLSGFVVATVLNSFFAYALIAIGVEKAYMQSSIRSGVVAAIIITVATMWYGTTGAAIAVTLSECVMAGLMYARFREHLRLRPGTTVISG